MMKKNTARRHNKRADIRAQLQKHAGQMSADNCAQW